MASRRMKSLLIASLVVVSGLFAYAWAETAISIRVAPNVLNILSQGEVVTVHTDIAFSSVDAHTVLLNGVPISSWKADDRGNFVAKFVMDEIKELELNLGQLNTLTLTGVTVGGEPFSGSAEILVVMNEPKK
ncbi:MAG: hypothetical protein JXN61_09670 [Sedimentisphaerales bacterium]|nr:hypothetical protein [Sedimentisphaerales bacterium]